MRSDRGALRHGALGMAAAAVATWLVVSSTLALNGPHRIGSAMPVAHAYSGGLTGILGSEHSMGANPPGSVPSGLFQKMVRLHARQDSVRRADCTNVPNPGYLHTDGMWIEDVNNCHVRLAGVTWYGMQTTLFVPAGLNFLPYTTILALIKSYGFNTVRVPISNTMIEHSPRYHVASKYIGANPGLAGIHPLQMLDKLVTAAGQVGLMVILDDHFTKARSPASYGVSRHNSVRTATQESWSGKDFITTSQWISDWVALTNRYNQAGSPVIGFDIRNEPHTDFPGPAGHQWDLHDYLTHGATWCCYKKSSLWNPASDWTAAATQAGNAILSTNPNLLIFVEGVQLFPDPTWKHGVETYWWGSILRGVAAHPVTLTVPHQLVYSPHEWGPWKCCAYGQFNKYTTYRKVAAIFKKNWAYILHSTDPAVQAPIWLGEFDTCNKLLSCVTNTRRGSQGQWFQIIVKFLKNNPEIGWSYYPINGTTSFDQPSNNSILNRHWTKPKIQAMMDALKTIETQPAN